MDVQAPLAFPALALVCGCAAGLTLEPDAPELAIPLVGALAGAGIAWRGRVGPGLAAAALGLTVAWASSARPTTPPRTIDPTRPLVVVGRLTEDWHRDPYGWRARMRVSHLRQGSTVAIWSREVGVALASALRPTGTSHIRARGYLRRSRPLANGRRTGPGPWTLRLKSARLVTPAHGAGEGAARRLILYLERRFEKGVDLLGEPAGLVVEALVLGRPAALGREVRQQLRRLGLSHLFAVSGLHAALLAGAVFAFTRSLGPTLRRGLVMAIVVLYALLTGARPATVRATLMTSLALVGLTLGRPALALQGLAGAVILMTVWTPEVVQDIGFQLSTSATAGILGIGAGLRERWTALPNRLASLLAASVGAQLGSGPWTLSRFGLLFPAAPVVNLVAVPWLAGVLGLSFSWAVLCLVDPRAATCLRAVLELAVRPLFLLSDVPASRVLTWPVSMGFPSAALAMGSLTATLLLRRSPALRAVLFAVFVSLVTYPGTRPGGELTMFDVGQGDGILLRDGGSAIMIDGGGWAGGDIAASVLLRGLAARGVRSLGGVIVTHGDIDHCGGLLDLAAYIPIGEILSAPVQDEGQCVERLTGLPHSRWVGITAGDRLSLGRWTIRVLHPPAGSPLRGNDRSVVVKIEGFRHEILLTGDVETPAELSLRRRWGPELRSGILKIAHHGSDTSSHPGLVAAVAPRLALVSAGRENRYGHPSPEVLKRLRRLGTRILRTDRDGMVSLHFDASGKMSVRTEGPP